MFMGTLDVGFTLDPLIRRLHGRDIEEPSFEWADEPIAQTLTSVAA